MLPVRHVALPNRDANGVLVGIVVLLIGYGSLYPFAWDFAAPRWFDTRLAGAYPDLVENIQLFLPLGLLLGWRWCAQRRSLIAATVWLLMALFYATLLQLAQIYLPRTPALADIVANGAGYLLGVALGLFGYVVLGRRFAKGRQGGAADLYAWALLLLWLVAELFPLLHTMDISTLKGHARFLLETPVWQPRRFVLHAGLTWLGLTALTVGLRSLRLDAFLPICGMGMVALMLLGKLSFVGQMPGASVLMGIACAWAVWLITMQMNDRRQMILLLVVALTLYLVHAVWPWQWSSAPRQFGWLPFASALDGSIESVVRSSAFEAMCFGALLWAAVRLGAGLGGSAVFVILLAFVAEWLQTYLPGRTPEITAALIAAGMAVLLRALPPRPAVSRPV